MKSDVFVVLQDHKEIYRGNSYEKAEGVAELHSGKSPVPDPEIFVRMSVTTCDPVTHIFPREDGHDV